MAAHLLDVDCDDDEPARAAAPAAARPAAAAAGGPTAAGPPTAAGSPPGSGAPSMVGPAAADACAACADGASTHRGGGGGAAQAAAQPRALQAAVSLGVTERAEVDAMPWHELVGHSAFNATPCSLPPLFASGATLGKLGTELGLTLADSGWHGRVGFWPPCSLPPMLASGAVHESLGFMVTLLTDSGRRGRVWLKVVT